MFRRQVRRMITNKPCQERLINMTEARKEIVAILKYHRTTMKLANEHKQLQLHQQHQPLSFLPSFYSRFIPRGRFKAKRRPKMYPPYSNKILHYSNDFFFSSPFLLLLFPDLLFLFLLIQFQIFTQTPLLPHLLNHPLSQKLSISRF